MQRRDRERRASVRGIERTNQTAIGEHRDRDRRAGSPSGDRDRCVGGRAGCPPDEDPRVRESPRRYRTSRWPTCARGSPGAAVGALRARARVRVSAITMLVRSRSRSNAERVIAWVLVGDGAIAALVYPAVDWLARFRFVPRALAVVLARRVVGLGAIGFVGLPDRRTTCPTRRPALQQAAPQRGGRAREELRFFREIKLQERVTNLVDAIPKRLAGGGHEGAEVGGDAAGSRSSPGSILTIFFISYGDRVCRRRVRPDRRRRRRAGESSTCVRAARGARLFFARVKVLGGARRRGARVRDRARAGVPGPAALGVWVGLWSLLPVAGVVIGALPIVVFAGAHIDRRARSWSPRCFVVIGDRRLVDQPLARTPHVEVGSFLIVFAAFGGLELDGLTGALLFVLGVVLVVSIIDEIGPEEVGERDRPRSRRRCESVDAEDDGARRREPAAGAVHAAELGVLDLPAVRLAAELARGFDEQEHAAHAGVAVREAAAVGVGGQRAAEAQLAVGDERAALALLAEAERLEGRQHHGRERVVDLAACRCLRASRPRARTRGGRLRSAGDSVKSSHSLIVVWLVASPVPSTHTGFLAQVARALLAW